MGMRNGLPDICPGEGWNERHQRTDPFRDHRFIFVRRDDPGKLREGDEQGEYERVSPCTFGTGIANKESK